MYAKDFCKDEGFRVLIMQMKDHLASSINNKDDRHRNVHSGQQIHTYKYRKVEMCVSSFKSTE